MKTRNRGPQPGGIHAVERPGKTAEGTGRLKCLLRGFDFIEGDGVFKKGKDPPVIAGAVPVQQPPVKGRNGRKHQEGISWLGRQVLAHQANVLHHDVGLLENLVVQALQEPGPAATLAPHIQAKRVVDVTRAKGLASHKTRVVKKLTDDIFHENRLSNCGLALPPEW